MQEVQCSHLRFGWTENLPGDDERAVDPTTKARLRATVRQRLSALTPEQTEAARQNLLRTLMDATALSHGTRLMAYSPTGNEADIGPFLHAWLAAKRPLYFPKVNAETGSLSVCRVSDMHYLRHGYKGIMEPYLPMCPTVPPQEIDAILVPGVAFDFRGSRLGQGGGHYDRFLPTLRAGCIRIGVCHPFQLLQSGIIPLESHDQRMDYICTPQDFLACATEGEGGHSDTPYEEGTSGE